MLIFKMLLTVVLSRESPDQTSATKLSLQKGIQYNTEKDLSIFNVSMIRTLKPNLQFVKQHIFFVRTKTYMFRLI
jgi:hypothetical protein